MANLITNQATLTYRYNGTTDTVTSNVATALMQGPLTVEKSSLSADYRPGDEVTYTLAVANNGAATLTNISIVDDLGTYAVAGPVSVTPLSYVGPASLYVNGSFVSTLTPTVAAHSVTFTIASLAPGANALIIFRTAVNDYAPKDTALTLTNNSTFNADGISEAMYASHVLATEDYADLRIVKTMTPDPVTDGGILTYRFAIYNYGNMDATDVVLSDAFDPAPAGLSIALDSVPVEPAQYEYAQGVLTLPAAGATLSITVPAATFTQDETTGLITASPGMVNVLVSGTI